MNLKSYSCFKNFLLIFGVLLFSSQLYTMQNPALALTEVLYGFPVHAAAAKGDIKDLERLRNVNFNMNSRDLRGNTPLHCAVRSQQLTAVQFLIHCNVNLNALNLRGWLPIFESPTREIYDLLKAAKAPDSCFTTNEILQTIKEEIELKRALLRPILYKMCLLLKRLFPGDVYRLIVRKAYNI